MLINQDERKHGWLALATAAGLAALAFGVSRKVRHARRTVQQTDWLGVCDDSLKQLENRLRGVGDKGRA